MKDKLLKRIECSDNTSTSTSTAYLTFRLQIKKSIF